MLDPDSTKPSTAQQREPWYAEHRWVRHAPLAGVVSFLLWVIAVFVLESADSPADEATPADIASYFNEESGAILAGAFIFMLGSAVFLWFLGTLRARFHAVEGGTGRLASIVFASGIVTAAMAMATLAPQVGGALAADEGEVEPGSAQAFWNAGDGFFLAAEAALVVFYLAAGLAILRTRVLPVWLAWVSFLFALVALVPPVGWSALVWGLPLWVLVASVLAWLRPGVAEQGGIGSRAPA